MPPLGHLRSCRQFRQVEALSQNTVSISMKPQIQRWAAMTTQLPQARPYGFEALHGEIEYPLLAIIIGKRVAVKSTLDFNSIFRDLGGTIQQLIFI